MVGESHMVWGRNGERLEAFLPLISRHTIKFVWTKQRKNEATQTETPSANAETSPNGLKQSWR